MLKIDEKSWAKCRPKDYGSLDFVELKTHDFLHMQQELISLNYSSIISERPQTIDNKVDIMMMDIALSSRKKYNKNSDMHG